MTEAKSNKESLVIFYDQARGVARVELEKRILPRIPVDKEIVIGINESETQKGYLVNLSGSGAQVKVNVSLHVDQIVDLRVDEKSPPFCRAKVIRIIKNTRSYGIKWLEFREDHLPKGFLVKEKM